MQYCAGAKRLKKLKKLGRKEQQIRDTHAISVG